MSKVAATSAFILALLTGLALGQFESRDLHFGGSEFTGSHRSPRALATARAFYEGLDRLLATGDRSMETTVAPGFVDHTLNGQGDRTLQQMIDGWLAVGSTFPDLQLTILEMEQRDLSNDPAELWVFSHDISRKEQKALGDATAEPAQPLTVAFIPMQIPTEVRGSPRRLSITLLTLPPGSTVTPHTPGIVEEIAVLSGAIEVTVDRGRALICTDGNTARPFDGTVTIAAGSGVSANEMASLGYRVADPQPATLLIMTIGPAPSPGQPEGA